MTKNLPMAAWVPLVLVLAAVAAENTETYGEPVSGYRGIWYANQKTNNEYVYKYSGGLGTYCAKHIPMAVYAPAVNKTFFVFGGTSEARDTLWEMVSYYDHATGQVPQPGPQPYNPGGEMAVWVSADQGVTWAKERQLTEGSVRNHTYARRPLSAQDDFLTIWADGHGRQPSESHLYFWNKKAGEVRQLPYSMDSDMAIPPVVNLNG